MTVEQIPDVACEKHQPEWRQSQMNKNIPRRMEERGGPGTLSKGDFSRKRESNFHRIHATEANTTSQGNGIVIADS